MRYFLPVIITILMFSSCTENSKTFSEAEISIVPKPTTMVLEEYSFSFSKKTTIFIENEIMRINIHKGFEEKKHDKEAETEFAKNVVVHFWKGNLELATQAAEKGYGIVNSLHSNTYLDYSYKGISLEKAYSFNPIPEGLDEQYHKNIYGLGCQMWSEWTPTNADVGWTQLENKNYESFKVALKKMQKLWDGLGINHFIDVELNENIKPYD